MNTTQDYYNIKDQSYLRLVEQAHLTRMEDRYAEQWWQMANNEMEYVLNKVPNHPKGLFRLTGLYGKAPELSKDDVALRFRCAIEMNPEIAATRLLYGIHLHRHVGVDEGIEAYREALRLNPNYAEAHYNLALALIDKGAIAEAKEHGTKAYALGYPLPGVRNKLKKLGAWP